MNKIYRLLLRVSVFLAGMNGITANAQNLKVAIAANLQPVMKVLQEDFTKRTGIIVDAISGPSGNLTTQIKNGAPFDVFLSADMGFPQELFKSGLAVQKPVVYASGALIICSTQKLDFNNWQKLLSAASIEKIAIGNPEIAPYGKAAEEALKYERVYDKMKDKIVLGESITQVNTYITTGVVQVGFTTLSLVKDADIKTKLYYKVVNPKTYKPIEQSMVLVKQKQINPQAEKFYRYILSAPAKKIFTRFGYKVN
ncbi:molybdate ABC transporter substrate-binding protein [Mucilaginibacter pedocola]|uniref:Molybdate ABC transporter substrate-binding protein n=1 Tax=Mucilaginibacter pedocola TaxID=1792845 RepID=A0A1S9P9N5_9SPHI|nr:molybdate ABC transporter substrate-binding protein [Mucilaginibacter pedocola]OOQ57629.1 molybdate ABC transporter substrate-binding protein [Mucilaginibacter pedocola]